MFAKLGCLVRSAGDGDELLYSLDVGQHPYGEFSLACVQANRHNEDYCQVETCSSLMGTFVGIYDGHGGQEAARFIRNSLFPRLMRCVVEMGGMSADALSRAFNATERGFASLVAEEWPTNPWLAAVGSCCLAAVICNGTVYIANVGDSRAVLGSMYRATGAVTHVQLTSEHNARHEGVRQELRSLHPEDSNIAVLQDGVWRVKGIIQLSRSIGDVYLKKQEFNREPLPTRLRLPALPQPVLTAEPAILVHELQPHDRFLIFASDALWELLSNQEAVEIVNKHPHRGAARRLVKAGLERVAEKLEMPYRYLKKIERSVRHHFHDDSTVIVVFLDHELMRRVAANNVVAPVGVLHSHSVSAG